MEVSIERNCWSFNLDRKALNAKDLLNEYLGNDYWPFPPKVLSEAWVRSMAACECRLDNHQHAVPCGVALRLASRGREGEGAWEAHHMVPEGEGGSDKLENCAIMCWWCQML